VTVDGPALPTDRLDFILPEFKRVSWVNAAIEETWAPRFARIVRAWKDLEWRSAAEGLRQTAIFHTAHNRLPELQPDWLPRGFRIVRLPAVPPLVASYTAGVQLVRRSTRPLVDIALGAADAVAELEEAWVARRHGEIGRLLGYPECCACFFEEVRVAAQCLDSTWAMASPSISNGSSDLSVGGPLATNVLWRSLGLRAVPHLPCSFDCAPSVRFGDALLDLGGRLRYRAEVDWLREILSWPVQWSALHGIAEIKTPLLKLATRTDATVGKYTLVWRGQRAAPDSAVGLAFPYRLPMHPGVSGSRAFQRGLDNAAEQKRNDK
jgi:hypothetical protein